MEPFKVRFKFTQMLKIFWYGSMLTVVCTILFSIGFVEDGGGVIIFQLIGALGLLFFIPLLIFLFFAWVLRRAAFIISEEGITDKTQLYSSGLVKWNEIERMTIGCRHEVTFLTVELYHSDVFREKANPTKRLYFSLTETLSSEQIQIDVSRLAISEEDLISQFEKYSKGRFNRENITENTGWTYDVI
ncbi:hypothetical protein JNUCC1_02064 [Lentibacillus sp. JNUCC-1]|nr:hypothetical protein [Lentibacillus sp. JNUCC-1]